LTAHLEYEQALARKAELEARVAKIEAEAAQHEVNAAQIKLEIARNKGSSAGSSRSFVTNSSRKRIDREVGEPRGSPTNINRVMTPPQSIPEPRGTSDGPPRTPDGDKSFATAFEEKMSTRVDWPETPPFPRRPPEKAPEVTLPTIESNSRSRSDRRENEISESSIPFIPSVGSPDAPTIKETMTLSNDLLRRHEDILRRKAVEIQMTLEQKRRKTEENDQLEKHDEKLRREAAELESKIEQMKKKEAEEKQLEIEKRASIHAAEMRKKDQELREQAEHLNNKAEYAEKIAEREAYERNELEVRAKLRIKELEDDSRIKAALAAEEIQRVRNEKLNEEARLIKAAEDAFLQRMREIETEKTKMEEIYIAEIAKREQKMIEEIELQKTIMRSQLEKEVVALREEAIGLNQRANEREGKLQETLRKALEDMQAIENSKKQLERKEVEMAMRDRAQKE